MSTKLSHLKFFVLTAIFFATLFLPVSAEAQRRPHLSEMEVDIVREAQAIDARTEVFIKAIDRRFLVINNQTLPDDKKSRKDSEIWGELPAGTRLELFLDIKKILAEAIDNIDDVAAHNKMDDKLFPAAVRRLAAAAQKYLPEFKSAFDKTKDEKEKGVILSSIEFCDQIIEASAKIPKDEIKDKKKKDDN